MSKVTVKKKSAFTKNKQKPKSNRFQPFPTNQYRKMYAVRILLREHIRNGPCKEQKSVNVMGL